MLTRMGMQPWDSRIVYQLNARQTYFVGVIEFITGWFKLRLEYAKMGSDHAQRMDIAFI